MDPRGASRAAAFAAVSLAAALTLALWQRRLSRRRSTRKKASSSSREGQELPEWIANAAAAMPCLDAPGGGGEVCDPQKELVWREGLSNCYNLRKFGPTP